MLWLLFWLLVAQSVRSEQVGEAGTPATTETITVLGVAEDTDGAPVEGVRLEFLRPGSPEKKSAVTGPEGNYSLSLPAGAYDILLYLPQETAPHRGQAWLGNREQITVNVRVPKQTFPGVLEYDVVGEWQVVNEQGRGIGPAKVTLEALLRDGRRVRVPVYLFTADGEKETDGQM